jgi:hypothetical protein
MAECLAGSGARHLSAQGHEWSWIRRHQASSLSTTTGDPGGIGRGPWKMAVRCSCQDSSSAGRAIFALKPRMWLASAHTRGVSQHKSTNVGAFGCIGLHMRTCADKRERLGTRKGGNRVRLVGAHPDRVGAIFKSRPRTVPAEWPGPCQMVGSGSVRTKWSRVACAEADFVSLSTTSL